MLNCWGIISWFATQVSNSAHRAYYIILILLYMVLTMEMMGIGNRVPPGSSLAAAGKYEKHGIMAYNDKGL